MNLVNSQWLVGNIQSNGDYEAKRIEGLAKVLGTGVSWMIS